MLAIVLALCSSVAYGVSDFLGGAKGRTLSTLSVLLVSQGASLVLLAAVVVAHGEGLPGGSFLLAAALAGLTEAVGVAALYRGLAAGTMSIVAPVAATAPVVPVAAGILIGEAPAPLQLAGVLLAIVGIVLTSSPGTPEQPATGQKPSSRANRASAGFGILAALGFGGFYVAMDAASEVDVPWALFGARVTAVAAFAVAAAVSRSRPALSARDLPVLALIGVLIVSADGMYAVASTVGLLGVVAVLSSLHPLVTMGLARFYFNERLRRPQQIGVALCIAGVVAVAA
jgi:drug/metabolite transporter (DMT)-like permease